ncbi:alpha/beta hydrolase [Clostridium sp. D2Q-11]|uniref:Alpha/beta hydrolase n=1 Tax=Anaeromonas frigoriresistens TaxID=2683708 RepID=A0A942Z9E7_9FIRM|nr:alpha/beta fold hydrolase [Anaeromonas frigoriresistens]MBS4539049.1 alpha/beta hydrolase [Anaeromonas frigoriresistens]
MDRHKIVLVHGYFRTSRDMKKMKGYLVDLGYDAICVGLPLTFSEIDNGLSKFSLLFEDIVKKLDKKEKISMVGHSTGGLVIRKFLLENSQYINYVDKCILISTPNNGSEIADIVNTYLKVFPRVFRTIKSLVSDKVAEIDSLSDKDIKIGGIAGNKSNLITSRLLSDISDGRVTVASVKHEDLDDFVILPYNHTEIHHRKETAEYIHNFIQNDRFK